MTTQNTTDLIICQDLAYKGPDRVRFSSSSCRVDLDSRVNHFQKVVFAFSYSVRLPDS